MHVSDKPIMIIARTIKGKGVSLVEDKNDWYGKALGNEEFDQAIKRPIPHEYRSDLFAWQAVKRVRS